MNIVIHKRTKKLGNSECDSIITAIDFDEDSKPMVSFCVIESQRVIFLFVF